MKIYKNEITLNKNRRGCYILDTVKGCTHGSLFGGWGCYGDCYAASIARRYGFNFNHTVNKVFNDNDFQIDLFGIYNTKHKLRIIRQIEKIDMPFIRIGEMGDPSISWDNTIDICKIISVTGVNIVIITKHIKKITGILLNGIEKLNITFNTSISALDTDKQIDIRLNQFYRLKKYCNSVLRVVTCDFNTETEIGAIKRKIQLELLNNDKVIDTVFRPSKTNIFVAGNIIKTRKAGFMDSIVDASILNENTYLGKCKNCPDMCGIWF